MAATNVPNKLRTGSPTVVEAASAPETAIGNKKLHGRAFYESLGSPKFVLAPMVDQSEFVSNGLCASFYVILTSTPGLASSHTLLHDPIHIKFTLGIYSYASCTNVHRDAQISRPVFPTAAG
jgi:tRNA-dihydrouridine synthase 1